MFGFYLVLSGVNLGTLLMAPNPIAGGMLGLCLWLAFVEYHK